MALVVVCPLASTFVAVLLTMVQRAPPSPEVALVNKKLLVKGVFIEMVKLVGPAKKFVAAERAS